MFPSASTKASVEPGASHSNAQDQQTWMVSKASGMHYNNNGNRHRAKQRQMIIILPRATILDGGWDIEYSLQQWGQPPQRQATQNGNHPAVPASIYTIDGSRCGSQSASGTRDFAPQCTRATNLDGVFGMKHPLQH